MNNANVFFQFDRGEFSSRQDHQISADPMDGQENLVVCQLQQATHLEKE